MPEKTAPHAKFIAGKLDTARLASGIEFLEMRRKQSERGIEDADVIVVAGRGLRKPEDIAMLEELAGLRAQRAHGQAETHHYLCGFRRGSVRGGNERK